MTGQAENSQLLGVGRVDLIVDTDQWTAAIQQGETRLSRMTEAALDDYGKLNSAEKRRVDSLLKQVDAIGKTREQQLLMNAAANGLSKFPALMEELRNRVASAADATKRQADNTKELGDALKNATLSDAQIFKANQSLADFKRRSDEAAQAQLALAAKAEEAARRTAEAQYKAAMLSPAQLLRSNQGLSSFAAASDEARRVQEASAAADAADQARIREMVRASLDRVAADQQVMASQQRSIEMTDAQRAAVERIKASQQSQADVSARGQRILDAEARSRQNAATATRGESDELRKLLGQIDPATAAYERLDRMEQQLRAHRRSGAISQDDFETYSAKINKARDEVDKTDKALTHFSLTSGVARREIGTLIGELARGDFGNFQGSLITLANNTGLLATLLSPAALGVGALAGGLGILAAAAASAYIEEQRLNEAIAVSGNFAGVTSGSFEKMASGIGGATGHLGEARDVLNSLVASGRVSADSLEAVGQAGYDIAILTKKGAEEAAQAATQMFDGTVASLLKANEQYHFLNEETYERVKALEEEGRQQEAVRVAAEAFHDQVGPRIQQMTDQVYGLAKAWEEAKRGTANWYQTFQQGAALLVGTASDQERIYDLLSRKASSSDGSGQAIWNGLTFRSFGPDEQKELDMLQARAKAAQEFAESESKQRADASASIAADQRIDQMSNQVDKAHQLSAAIKALNADFETLWGKSGDNKRLADVQRIVGDDGSISFAGGQYDVLRKDLEKKFADNSGAKLANADAAAQLSAFKASLSQYTDAYANAQRELDAQRKSGSVSEAEYFQRSRDEVWKTEQAQVDAIQAEIDLLQRRKVAGADKARNDAEIAELSGQARKAEADALSKVNVLNEQEAASKAKSTAAINAYIAALGQQTAARQAEIDLQVAAVGMGDKEFAQLQRINRIRQDAADQQVKLTKQLNTVGEGGIDQATYAAKVSELKKATEDRVQAELDGQQRIDAARADWQNGALRAMDDFRDQAQDSAGLFNSFLQTTNGNLADFLTTASTKGQLSIKGFVTTTLTELTRLESSRAASQLLGLGLSWLTGSPALSSSDNSALLQQSVGNDISGFTFNAKGNVYTSPSLSAYSSQVYDSPQLFAFAKGAGVFAEAGPEAIMPLTRTSDGKLGVRSSGGSGGGDVLFDIDVTVNADGSGSASSQGDYQQFGAQMGSVIQASVQRELQRAMAPGGQLWRRGG
ncbi:phage tail tape measure protein [Luteibacter sp. PPL552]